MARVSGARSIAELETMIKAAITDSMQNDVVNDIKDDLALHAEIDVYEAYPNPKDYVRTGQLSDPAYMDTEGSSEGKVVVTPVATFQDSLVNYGNELAGLVNEGNGAYKGYEYEWTPPQDRDPTYLNSRPYIDKTVEDLEDNKVAVMSLATALEKRGIKVKRLS